MPVRSDPDPGEQLAAAIAGGDPYAIADVASRHIWRLFSGHFRQFISAVLSLPGDVLQQYPALYLVHPSSAVTIRSTRPLEVSVFKSYEGDGGEGPAICTVLQMLAARASGDLITAVTYGKHLSELIRRNQAGDTNSPYSPIWFFHQQIGSTLLCAGNTRTALRKLATARQYGEVQNNVDAVRSTVGRAAIAYALRGSIDDAERALRTAQSLSVASEAFHSNALSTEATAAAMIAVERMDPEVEDRIAALAEVDVFDVIWPFIFLARVRYQLATQRPSAALETIQVTRGAHLIQAGTLADDLLTATQVDTCLVLGQVDATHDLIESIRYPGPYTRLAQLRIALHESDLAEVHRRYGVVSVGSLSPADLAEFQLLKACAESIEYGKVSQELAARIAELAATGHRDQERHEDAERCDHSKDGHRGRWQFTRHVTPDIARG